MRKITRVFAAAWLMGALATLGHSAGPGEGERAAPAANAMVTVEVLRVVLLHNHPAVVLKDGTEARYLVVYIDPFMAQSIQMGMLGLSIERPLTHDLIGILLNRLGAKIHKVSITELRDNTYFALISLRVNGAVQEIDARPSDALAIAVRTKAPIYVARALMSDTMFPEGEAPAHITPDGPVGPKHGA